MILLGTVCLRAVPSSRRLAVFELGEFRTLKGPGTVFRMPFGHFEWITVSFGDCGELVAADKARFHGRDFPAGSKEALPIGVRLRVVGFEDNKVLVAPDEFVREVVCPNCSSRFEISAL